MERDYDSKYFSNNQDIESNVFKSKDGRAKRLLHRIFEEFGSDTFTLEEVTDSFNCYAGGFSGSGLLDKFGPASLGYLVSEGFLQLDETNGTYSLVEGSNLIANLI
tara:strand:- start:393 stop:710 length:318 start_codon:yes stop_codon:yes gene_type:complete